MNTNTYYHLSACFNDIIDTPVSPQNDKCRQLLASQTRQRGTQKHARQESKMLCTDSEGLSQENLTQPIVEHQVYKQSMCDL